MKNIILLGAPGAGKGSQATKIATEYNIPHISTGDILRKNIKEQTELGKMAKSYIDQGQLVPDDVVVAIVEDRLKQDDAKNGYLLDGFPRTIAQADALKKFTTVNYVLNLQVPFELIMDRITGRRMCTCGESYHVSTLNGSNKCKVCGKELYVRDDDKPETVENRLNVYNEQTKPLIEYYKKDGVVYDIDGSKAISEVYDEIKKVLDK
ncbi:MAG: adenylate kinase [Clostridia bacterium]|nr:adenylate kinase [Clostridia bacterium]MDY5263761.1 adenylate kinase [Eubacteriales bacterium]MDY5439193.1 adenylate kinase [Eubacteriales bacterium]